jgi:hypothetical protein
VPLNGSVMAREAALSYRVSQNGSPDDWYWEVVFDGTVIDRGLAPTSAQARAQAMKVAALTRSGSQGNSQDRSTVPRVQRHLEDCEAVFINDRDVEPNEGVR